MSPGEWELPEKLWFIFYAEGNKGAEAHIVYGTVISSVYGGSTLCRGHNGFQLLLHADFYCLASPQKFCFPIKYHLHNSSSQAAFLPSPQQFVFLVPHTSVRLPDSILLSSDYGIIYVEILFLVCPVYNLR